MTFTLDRRRPAPEGPALHAARWFAETLPGLLARNGAAAARAAMRLELPPLVIDVDGWQGGLRLRDGELVIDVGDPALTVELSDGSFSDWVREVRTARALSMTGELHRHGGSVEQLDEWELVLRTIVEGTPVHEPGSIDFVDCGGAPLDLHRVFTPDDDPSDIAHFLRAAGYLHLRGWVDPADMHIVGEDIDRARPQYAPDDGRSWWSTLEDGSEACVRPLVRRALAHDRTVARE